MTIHIVRTAQLEDLLEIQNADRQFEEIGDISVAVTEAIESDMARTFICGECPANIYRDHIIAIVGIMLPRPKCASSWSLISQDLHGAALMLTRKCLSLIDEVQKFHDLQRMDMLVSEAETMHIRWATTLGFRNEGLVRNYGPNRTHYWLMARTWG